MATPLLKWAGGKRQLVDALTSHFDIPLKGSYYEPFVGGGALFFHLNAMHGLLKFNACLNDANPDLISVYRQVRSNVKEVIDELGRLDESMKKRGLKDTYADIRFRFNEKNPLVNPRRRAAWFIAMNAWGFNGLCRYNRNGGFNVPVGKFTKIPVLVGKAENLRAASTALQNTKITIGDFAGCVADAKKGDVVYFDPPYIPVNATSNFTSYTTGAFDMSQQRRLMAVASELVDRGVRVLLSNSDTPATRALYRGAGFHFHEVQARRAVNSNAKKRGKVGELILVGKS